MALIIPIDMGSEVPYCGECGHFHLDSCPERDEPCGSYLCCVDYGSDDRDEVVPEDMI